MSEPSRESGRSVRFFLDTEFIERPGTIDLISVGIVAADGRTLYAESSETNWSQANDWVLANVKPHMRGPAMSRADIRDNVLRFVGDDTPEFWGYYADYDWVVFCWLFGSMIDLPDGWPMYCRDLKQWADSLGGPRLPEQTSTEHHALADAEWNREAWIFLARTEWRSRQ